MFGFFKRGDAGEAAAPESVMSATSVSPTRLSPIPRVRRRMLGGGYMGTHDAAQNDRLQSGWTGTPIPADVIIRRDQRVLVARARQQAINNDYARAFLRMARQNVVGPRGIQMQAQPRDQDGSVDNAAADAIEAAWREWGHARHCDIVGQQSFRALQGAAVASAARDGEFMFQKILGSDGGEFRFSLKLLDPQRCPPDFDETPRRDGTFIRAGIEFDSYGRRRAYYFTSTDESETYVYSSGGRNYVRIPANQIIHGYLHELPGQRRGLPWMSTSLWRMRQLKGFEDSALVNARVSAAKGGFFEWEDGYGPETDEDDEDITMEAEPGAFQELPPGVRFKEWNPQYPSGEYQTYVKSMLRGIASGMGVAYNNLANDLEGVNFSSIRQGALDEREAWKEIQEWLVETLMEPVFEEWLPRALVRGISLPDGKKLDVNRLTKYREVMWQPRRWAWIDPKSEVAAAVASKNNLLSSPGQIIRDTGRDPDTVWREISSDIKAMRDAGIDDKFIMQAMGQKLNTEGPDDAAPKKETE